MALCYVLASLVPVNRQLFTKVTAVLEPASPGLEDSGASARQQQFKKSVRGERSLL